MKKHWLWILAAAVIGFVIYKKSDAARMFGGSGDA